MQICCSAYPEALRQTAAVLFVWVKGWWHEYHTVVEVYGFFLSSGDISESRSVYFVQVQMTLCYTPVCLPPLWYYCTSIWQGPSTSIWLWCVAHGRCHAITCNMNIHGNSDIIMLSHKPSRGSSILVYRDYKYQVLPLTFPCSKYLRCVYAEKNTLMNV